MPRLLLTSALLLALAGPAAAQVNPREKKVRDDKAKVEAAGYWIYNDLPKARAEAKAAGKPIVAVFRCIPCEECVKLDDELVDTDEALKPLLAQYVRVRIVSANGLDLSLFQYDTDQSFAVFMLNADGTIYGRFGTRSDRTNWIGDVSLLGLAKALAGGLELHREYAARPAGAPVPPGLAAKRGPAPLFPVPERFPALTKYGAGLDYQGKVVQSCIHCHQVGDAQREHLWKAGPLPEDVLFPYPHPKALGLILDPRETATVKDVVPGSPAEAAGFKAGDSIRAMNGQRLLSIADVQWVLQRTPPAGGTIAAEVRRGGATTNLTWKLPASWRRADDLSWRASSWGLRRMATGGIKLEPLPGGRPAGVPATGMALLAKHVGEYGPHAAAKNAGFRKDDVIVSFDGRTDLTRESDVFAHVLLGKRPGDAVAVRVVRAGRPLDLKLPVQP
ncbi:Trx7/PDZ domain-containing (seleno)protein [Urbifossiella limnaea]|uniref:Zinc metallopeptidase RseP n=1 Tax=Urbifossiella limnaea TaxID=2528023 RepID=A0A517XLM4_9BACT|nr:Trx7/PDZ domain-containing (seleno)protein [Urbifossiella limnaea]QDU18399.1 zinc metallopeptidase RseP [Urbifossiella limnaea]